MPVLLLVCQRVYIQYVALISLYLKQYLFNSVYSKDSFIEEIPMLVKCSILYFKLLKHLWELKH